MAARSIVPYRLEAKMYFGRQGGSAASRRTSGSPARAAAGYVKQNCRRWIFFESMGYGLLIRAIILERVGISNEMRLG
jgi:hypothetical protein